MFVVNNGKAPYWRFLAIAYILVAGVFVFAIEREFARIDSATIELARERGNALFRLIELVRDWNAQHGGIYAVVTEQTQPNPYLEHPKRDLETLDGTRLTMINPAFMTRQIAEIAHQADGVQFHITSLKPIRPANQADPWETQALTEFEQGLSQEKIELVSTTGQPAFRFMAPLYVKPACMACHEKQGYQVGDIRGGISVTLPARAQLLLASQDRSSTLLGYSAFALIILVLIHVIAWRTNKHFRDLQQVNSNQEALIAQRTASLTDANEQLQQEIQVRRRTERNLRIAATAVENASEGIMVVDADNRIISVNPGFCAITGYAAGEVIGQQPGMLAATTTNGLTYQSAWSAADTKGRWEGEVWSQHRDGSIYPQWLSISTIGFEDNTELRGQAKYVATFIDITEHKATEALLDYKAHTDALTQLPNRLAFFDQLNHTLSQARRHQDEFALLYIDLDGFKEVNDTKGHGAGDELLTEAASRLCGAVRGSDAVGRLGGDEFAVIAHKLATPKEADEVAKRIVRKLSQPFLLSVGTVQISCSVGIAFYPRHAQDIPELVHAADQALYAVKASGRNGYQTYQPGDVG